MGAFQEVLAKGCLDRLGKSCPERRGKKIKAARPGQSFKGFRLESLGWSVGMKAVLVIVFVGCVSLHGLGDELVPDAFINVQSIAPDIQLEMRYVTDDNFVGAPVDGYLDPICYLARPAAAALAKVQETVTRDGYGLVMFDCYRPQRAVNHFVRWSEGKGAATKQQYFPDLDQSQLFELGYIAKRSGHSRGATVDVGLLKLSSNHSGDDFGRERPAKCQHRFERSKAEGHVDFGSDYDCFDAMSHTASQEVSQHAITNRRYLVEVMARFGFENYDKEWWHFTYRPEPFPETYFDFPIINE